MPTLQSVDALHMAGTLPAMQAESFPALKYLSLRNNDLSGQLPGDLQAPAATDIYLSGNKFEGALQSREQQLTIKQCSLHVQGKVVSDDWHYNHAYAMQLIMSLASG